MFRAVMKNERVDFDSRYSLNCVQLCVEIVPAYFRLSLFIETWSFVGYLTLFVLSEVKPRPSLTTGCGLYSGVRFDSH